METYYQVCFRTEPLLLYTVCAVSNVPWLQESGRAGRDGHPAECLLYFRPADMPRQVMFLEIYHVNLCLLIVTEGLTSPSLV